MSARLMTEVLGPAAFLGRPLLLAFSDVWQAPAEALLRHLSLELSRVDAALLLISKLSVVCLRPEGAPRLFAVDPPYDRAAFEGLLPNDKRWLTERLPGELELVLIDALGRACWFRRARRSEDPLVTLAHGLELAARHLVRCEVPAQQAARTA